ncbi:MAG TPA: NAD-dependent epimerase/dehydratase family protein [Nevskiaceae bacterium]|nr:NAD-dependent epimerase/dehydratase family protein [Nevskiaceae bacterium]
MGTAFVTGGSGYVGRNLIRALVARRQPVRALARSESAAAAVKALGAEPVMGDLMDRRSYADGLRGCDVIYHSAAAVELWGPLEHFWQVNVEGTQMLLDAARGSGVPRFVHVSTEAVYADGGPMRDLRDDDPLPVKPLPRYPQTKGVAEERVRRANSRQLTTVVVRPRFIWGGDDTTLLPKLCEAARNGQLKWVDGGDYLTSTTHVDNVVEGLLLGAEKGEGGQTYFVTDGPPTQFKRFITDLLATQGVTIPDKHLSRGLAEPMARLCEWAWDHLPLKGEPPLTRMAYCLLLQEVTVSDEKARSELGYEGKTTIAQGLAELRKKAGR